MKKHTRATPAGVPRSRAWTTRARRRFPSILDFLPKQGRQKYGSRRAGTVTYDGRRPINVNAPCMWRPVCVTYYL